MSSGPSRSTKYGSSSQWTYERGTVGASSSSSSSSDLSKSNFSKEEGPSGSCPDYAKMHNDSDDNGDKDKGGRSRLSPYNQSAKEIHNDRYNDSVASFESDFSALSAGRLGSSSSSSSSYRLNKFSNKNKYGNRKSKNSRENSPNSNNSNIVLKKDPPNPNSNSDAWGAKTINEFNSDWERMTAEEREDYMENHFKPVRNHPFCPGYKTPAVILPNSPDKTDLNFNLMPSLGAMRPGTALGYGATPAADPSLFDGSLDDDYHFETSKASKTSSKASKVESILSFDDEYSYPHFSRERSKSREKQNPTSNIGSSRRESRQPSREKIHTHFDHECSSDREELLSVQENIDDDQRLGPSSSENKDRNYDLLEDTNGIIGNAQDSDVYNPYQYRNNFNTTPGLIDNTSFPNKLYSPDSESEIEERAPEIIPQCLSAAVEGSKTSSKNKSGATKSSIDNKKRSLSADKKRSSSAEKKKSHRDEKNRSSSADKNRSSSANKNRSSSANKNSKKEKSKDLKDTDSKHSKSSKDSKGSKSSKEDKSSKKKESKKKDSVQNLKIPEQSVVDEVENARIDSAAVIADNYSIGPNLSVESVGLVSNNDLAVTGSKVSSGDMNDRDFESYEPGVITEDAELEEEIDQDEEGEKIEPEAKRQKKEPEADENEEEEGQEDDDVLMPEEIEEEEDQEDDDDDVLMPEDIEEEEEEDQESMNLNPKFDNSGANSSTVVESKDHSSTSLGEPQTDSIINEADVNSNNNTANSNFNDNVTQSTMMENSYQNFQNWNEAYHSSTKDQQVELKNKELLDADYHRKMWQEYVKAKADEICPDYSSDTSNSNYWNRSLPVKKSNNDINHAQIGSDELLRAYQIHQGDTGNELVKNAWVRLDLYKDECERKLSKRVSDCEIKQLSSSADLLEAMINEKIENSEWSYASKKPRFLIAQVVKFEKGEKLYSYKNCLGQLKTTDCIVTLSRAGIEKKYPLSVITSLKKSFKFQIQKSSEGLDESETITSQEFKHWLSAENNILKQKGKEYVTKLMERAEERIKENELKNELTKFGPYPIPDFYMAANQKRENFQSSKLSGLGGKKPSTISGSNTVDLDPMSGNVSAASIFTQYGGAGMGNMTCFSDFEETMLNISLQEDNYNNNVKGNNINSTLDNAKAEVGILYSAVKEGIRELEVLEQRKKNDFYFTKESDNGENALHYQKKFETEILDRGLRGLDLYAYDHLYNREKGWYDLSLHPFFQKRLLACEEGCFFNINMSNGLTFHSQIEQCRLNIEKLRYFVLTDRDVLEVTNSHKYATLLASAKAIRERLVGDASNLFTGSCEVNVIDGTGSKTTLPGNDLVPTVLVSNQIEKYQIELDEVERQLEIEREKILVEQKRRESESCPHARHTFGICAINNRNLARQNELDLIVAENERHNLNLRRQCSKQLSPSKSLSLNVIDAEANEALFNPFARKECAPNQMWDMRSNHPTVRKKEKHRQALNLKKTFSSSASTTTPRSKAATPRSKAATPRSKAATPRSKAATPRSKAATPRSKAATPRSKAATPEEFSINGSNVTDRINNLNLGSSTSIGREVKAQGGSYGQDFQKSKPFLDNNSLFSMLQETKKEVMKMADSDESVPYVEDLDYQGMEYDGRLSRNDEDASGVPRDNNNIAYSTSNSQKNTISLADYLSGL